MLRIEHINLVVKNMNEMLKFYQAAFPHWNILREGHSDWYGKPRRWLHLGDDYLYLAIADDGEGDNRDLTGHQVGLAHFAFETSNLKQVVSRLQNAGFEVDKMSEDNDIRINAYFIDPAGFEVEFVEYKSDVPSERNGTH